MKKILYTATVASHICQFHLPYFKMFKDMGYEVHVAARNNLAEKNGLSFKYVDKFFEVPFRRSPFSPKNISAKKQLKKIIDEGDYELIVCNTPVGGVVTRGAAKAARKRGTRVFYIAHGFHFYKGASKKNWLLFYPIEKHYAKKCDGVITINEEDYLFAKEKFKTPVYRIHGVGVDPERYHSLSDGEKADKRLKMGYTTEDFLCLCVGELNDNKNQMQAIKAVECASKLRPNIKLLIAGNGPKDEELKAYVSATGLENNVKFLGYCTFLQEYQNIVDVGISCSIREGLGLNVIEAMLSGNPFVATKNRGHNELIENGVNGYLVDVGDSQELAKAILRLADDKELYDEMRKNTVKSMQAYTVSSTLSEMENILFGEKDNEKEGSCC